MSNEPISRENKWRIGLLSSGHFFTDCYSSAYGVLLPLLIIRHHLSYAAAGFMGALLIFSSSVMQPVYGYLSDRYLKRAFSVLGPALAAVFISSLCLAPTYPWVLVLLFLGGIGIAGFHPQSAALAAQAAGRRRGMGMSVFVSAGSVGYALGPIYFATVVHVSGLGGLYWAAMPGVAISLLILAKCPPLESRKTTTTAPRLWDDLKEVRGPLTLLYFLVVLRSAVQIVFAQFLPAYLVQRGYTLEQASQALSLYLFFGGVGGFAGGALADRFGGKRVIAYSMLLAAPAGLGFMLTRGPWSIALLALAGLILLFTTPVNVVMAQNLMPRSASTVSALMMGFAWGMAGMVCVPMVGRLADAYGLHNALFAVVLLPGLGYLLARRLPSDAPAVPVEQAPADWKASAPATTSE